jgi:hypothetical protein
LPWSLPAPVTSAIKCGPVLKPRQLMLNSAQAVKIRACKSHLRSRARCGVF